MSEDREFAQHVITQGKLEDALRKLDDIERNTEIIMVDLAASRKDYTDAIKEFTRAIVALVKLGGVAGLLVVVLCIAGFFGRNLKIGHGDSTADFGQQVSK